jgi:hypothetical protein
MIAAYRLLPLVPLRRACLPVATMQPFHCAIEHGWQRQFVYRAHFLVF